MVIGIETAGIEYENIVFRNCDLIHNSVGAMCISNGCYADMHDILFENINVEFQSNTLKERIQTDYYSIGASAEAEIGCMGKCETGDVYKNEKDAYAIITG